PVRAGHDEAIAVAEEQQRRVPFAAALSAGAGEEQRGDGGAVAGAEPAAGKLDDRAVEAGCEALADSREPLLAPELLHRLDVPGHARTVRRATGSGSRRRSGRSGTGPGSRSRR